MSKPKVTVRVTIQPKSQWGEGIEVGSGEGSGVEGVEALPAINETPEPNY